MVILQLIVSSTIRRHGQVLKLTTTDQKVTDRGLSHTFAGEIFNPIKKTQCTHYLDYDYLQEMYAISVLWIGGK